MIIDAKNKLKPEHFTQFASLVKGTIVVAQQDNTKVGIIAEIDVSHLVDCFLALDYFADTDVIVFSNEDTQMFVTGFDIHWWKENARRYNKLYRAIETPKESEHTYRAAIATLSEGILSNIKECTGTKTQLITFFNEEIKSRYLDDFLKMKVVLDLAYEDGDENDISQWLTLDQLEEMEVIKL